MKRHIRRYVRAPFVAFVILAFATAYSITAVQQEGKKRDDQNLATLAEGAVTGCISANNVTFGTHKVVVGAFNNGIPAINKLVLEGTLNPIQATRILSNSRSQTVSYLSDLPYRDCKRSSHRYADQISNATVKRNVIARVEKQYKDALRDRELHEPKLTS